MTEQEWLVCEDPRQMIFHAFTPALALRQFSVSCCRRLTHLLFDQRSLTLLDTIEQFACGKQSIDQWRAARSQASDAVTEIRIKSGSDYVHTTPEVEAADTVVDSADGCPATGAEFACYGSAFILSGSDGSDEESPLVKKQLKVMLDELRHIVGKPVHLTYDPVMEERAWLAMPHRRLLLPPKIEIIDWYHSDPYGERVFAELASATISEDPLKFSAKKWRESDQCPVCGATTFRAERLPATLHSRTSDERDWDDGVWVHTRCFARLPDAGKLTPFPRW